MLAEQLREFRRGDGGGADAGDLVGGERHADTRAAYEHAAVGIALSDGTGDKGGVIRVVHTLFRVGAKIDHILTELRREIIDEGLLLLKAGMVGSDCDTHR